MPLPRRWAGCRFGTTLPLEGATRGGLLLLAKCASRDHSVAVDRLVVNLDARFAAVPVQEVVYSAIAFPDTQVQGGRRALVSRVYRCALVSKRNSR